MGESGKIAIIANNIKGNASGQVRYDAKKISNTSGGIFTQNGKGSGVSHVDNTDRKEAVGIKITKLEGPFDEGGKLVKNVKAGVFYTFKATPSREPIPVEIPTLKWAIKPDDKEQYQVKGAGIYNRLIDNKIVIKLKMPAMKEKVKVYAFYEKPIESISVEAPLVKIRREIYLTFDDGIQAGTEEVLVLLKEKGIKATFFLTGVHLFYFIEKSKNRQKALNVLKEIYENHVIGNHSYSHVNDFYKNAYSEGIKYKGDGTKPKDKRSVFDDFTKCKEQILYYLDEISGKNEIKNRSVPLAKGQTMALARFPGRNTWYTKEFIDIDTDNNNDTRDEAKDLYEKVGYQVYGWDCEWDIKSWDFKKKSVESVQNKVSSKTMDFGNDEEAHPYYDMYSKQYIGFDRVSESWEKVRDELLEMVYDGGLWDDVGKKNGKVILLMHERAFRKGKLIDGDIDITNRDEINKLGKLIDYFKSINAEFKTLDKY